VILPLPTFETMSTLPANVAFKVNMLMNVKGIPNQINVGWNGNFLIGSRVVVGRAVLWF
jgi:hypothetical protein